MNPNVAKALANSAKRPLKTSKLNPYTMKKTVEGDIRVSPRLDAIKRNAVRQGAEADHPIMGRVLRSNIAENKALYATDKQEARASTAAMVKRFRKTGNLSADLKTIVEFAKMDLAEKPYEGSLGCCAPASPQKKYYPTLYINRQDKIDLPAKGKAVIEYRLRSKTQRQDENGKMTESADVEILSIDPELPPPPKKDGAKVIDTAQFAADLETIVEFARR